MVATLGQRSRSLVPELDRELGGSAGDLAHQPDTLGKSPWYPDRELVLGGRRGRTAACGRIDAGELAKLSGAGDDIGEEQLPLTRRPGLGLAGHHAAKSRSSGRISATSKETGMSSYNMNQVRVGLKILIDGDPCIIVDADFVKPGKGQAFTRIKYRNLKTDRVNERTMRSSDMVDGADVVEKPMQYLYNDGSHWYFMDQESYEQLAADGHVVVDAAQWIKEEDVCLVTLFDGNPLVVQPPNFVELEIVETDPGVRGDTSSGGTKPATLETGAVVRVPLFVQQGERIKVDTRTGAYVSRA